VHATKCLPVGPRIQMEPAAAEPGAADIQVREVQRHAGTGRRIGFEPIAVGPDARPPATSERRGNIGVNDVVPVTVHIDYRAAVDRPCSVTGTLPCASYRAGGYVQTRGGEGCGVPCQVVGIVTADP